jgi:transcription initiation factor TFIIIB Brf1 subunit/transcription initiation factor TFIIB
VKLRVCPKCGIDNYSASSDDWLCHTCGADIPKSQPKDISKPTWAEINEIRDKLNDKYCRYLTAEELMLDAAKLMTYIDMQYRQIESTRVFLTELQAELKRVDCYNLEHHCVMTK